MEVCWLSWVLSITTGCLVRQIKPVTQMGSYFWLGVCIACESVNVISIRRTNFCCLFAEYSHLVVPVVNTWQSWEQSVNWSGAMMSSVMSAHFISWGRLLSLGLEHSEITPYKSLEVQKEASPSRRSALLSLVFLQVWLKRARLIWQEVMSAPDPPL